MIFKTTFYLPKSKKIIGIVMWLAISLAFYAFCQVSVELIRLMSTTDYHHVLILSKTEQMTINFFSAFIGLLVGKYYVFNYWFPSSTNKRMKRLTHDNHLIWYFLACYSKILLMHWVGLGYRDRPFITSFHFFEIYQIIFLLVMIVLYFSSWNNFILKFKNSLKPILLLFLVFIGLAFGLSQINILDSNAINQKLLSQNIWETKNIKLIKSNFADINDWRDLKTPVFVYPKNDDIEFYCERPFDQSELLAFVIGSKPYNYFKDSRLNFHIQQEVKMQSIYNIMFLMATYDFRKISFAVDYKDDTVHSGIYQNLFFSSQAYEAYDGPKVIIKQNKCELLFNDQPISTLDLKQKLSLLLKENKKICIFHQACQDLSFGEYFAVQIIIKSERQKILNEVSQKYFKRNYNQLNQEQRLKLVDEFDYSYPYIDLGYYDFIVKKDSVGYPLSSAF